MRTSILAAFGFALVLATQTRATDRVVGPPGSGAPFSSIQAAVDASQPGDRVLVLAGTYDGVVFIDKAIDVIGSGSAVVNVQTTEPAFPGSLLPPMRVTAIAAGARVRVSGLHLAANGPATMPVTHILKVDECGGIVELSDLVLQGTGLAPIPATQMGGILYVRNCAQVAISGVQSLGHDQAIVVGPTATISQVHGLAGAIVENSAVLMTDSTAIGNATRFVFFGTGGDGGHGMLAINSVIQVQRSVIRGAQSAGLLNGVAGAGGHGIRAQGSIVVVHGGVGNTTSGANALEFLSGSFLMLGTAGSGVSLDDASTLVYGADVSLAGGAGAASLPPGTAIEAAPGSVVDARAERLPTVSITPATAQLGATLTVRLSGEPGFEHIRAVALATAPAVSFPGALGSVVVDLAAVLFFHFDLLDPTGNLTALVPVPPDPSLAGVEIVEQCAQALPSGIVISPPVIITLVP